ncbi:exodeoxyribonuclease VII small subunit [Hydrogenispora ethanolica]|jgi:exodeoxyribonuclease VII small subunit|uniref:Exodeoxyribonuclease 7 small subunit n=1 Tax=Hydrogenispora ethanolica TaxID=1082276 RepID=A0A4R1RFJ4_HYDET|nr:exodeoxyribonuclease VII small subunit [Hydrogenispora ethanolica]TCL64748.1 exodeoxyribonuclease VII small subunit [Hydrogenispora ethanolica]
MSDANKNKPGERSYEEAMERLTEIVQRLETGELSLEESLNLFEEGIGLAKFCTGKLDAAEGRLQILLGIENAEPKLGSFQLDQGQEEG